ncbi:28S ribosomal protein S23, mitochondrial isoform X2 [Nannospalax galili]|uniref:28S ribosomal protein S23, mitochondrial isoform X2 n=1 Tax=Nannospalax galili TaxID=1026970 RepID=UPI000819DA95|nr:28S ribosomal protein S23, mitochondrial isoform X2 [Nannospalax galili]
MAGSRLETVGSVFSRTRNLMRAGVLKEKPLWYDVYKAFPPLREPVFQKPNLRYGKAKATIQDIFYHEDRIRAKFFSAYGSGPKAFDLFNPNFKSTCERFVEKYIELQNLGETNEEKLFVETGKALLAEGDYQTPSCSRRKPAPERRCLGAAGGPGGATGSLLWSLRERSTASIPA